MKIQDFNQYKEIAEYLISNGNMVKEMYQGFNNEVNTLGKKDKSKGKGKGCS